MVPSTLMRKLIVVVAFALSTLASAPAFAQTCIGRPSFTDAPWQARVETSSSSDTRTFGGSVARGTNSMFGGVVADLTAYNGVDQTALSLGGSAGVERALGGRVQVCPVVTALHQFGPNVETADISANVVSAGGRIGIVASENQTLQVVPTIGVDAQWERDSVTSGGVKATSSRTFTVTRLGVGFILNRRTSIVPEIIGIFGVAADTTYRVTATFALGR